MTIVNVQEAKTRLSELLQRVESGEEITIARAGVPVALLRPAGKPKLIFGSMSQLGPVPDIFFETLPDDELELWEDGGQNDPVNQR